MTAMPRPYEEYLRSSHWKRRKAAYKRSHKRQCGICTSSARLHLHHLSYEYLGDERDDDLALLCESCHTLLHQLCHEGQADIRMHFLFLKERAVTYAETRTDRYEHGEKRLSELTPEERRVRNKRVRSGALKPRDWRDERALPRRA